MCKKFFYIFLHFQIFNLNQLSKNKIEPIEPIEPKLDFSLKTSDGYGPAGPAWPINSARLTIGPGQLGPAVCYAGPTRPNWLLGQAKSAQQSAWPGDSAGQNLGPGRAGPFKNVSGRAGMAGMADPALEGRIGLNIL